MRCNALSVLVMEPERAIASSLCSALERRGHRAFVASDADSALERETPDVLICGVESGASAKYDLLEAYARRGRQPRSILLLADPNALSFRRARELGVEDVFARPFRLDELMSSVERISESNLSSLAPSFSTFLRSYPCDEDVVDRAAHDIAAFALRSGVGPSARARLASAVAEIVENSFEHAYPTGGGMLEVEARLEERDVWVSLRDSGVGFDASEALGNDGGLDRATALTEGLDIRSASGQGTEVTLRVSIFRANFDTDQLVDLSELDFFTPATARRVLGVVRDQDAASFLELSPSLAVVLGRLLSGPSQRAAVTASLWRSA